MFLLGVSLSRQHSLQTRGLHSGSQLKGLPIVITDIRAHWDMRVCVFGLPPPVNFSSHRFTPASSSPEGVSREGLIKFLNPPLVCLTKRWSADCLYRVTSSEVEQKMHNEQTKQSYNWTNQASKLTLMHENHTATVVLGAWATKNAGTTETTDPLPHSINEATLSHHNKRRILLDWWEKNDAAYSNYAKSNNLIWLIINNQTVASGFHQEKVTVHSWGE